MSAPTWHPLLAAVEPEPGVWVLLDSLERPYADVRLVRRGRELGYRASTHGQLVGYFTTLRAACYEAHMAYVRAHGPHGAPNGGSGYPGWETAKAPPPSEEGGGRM